LLLLLKRQRRGRKRRAATVDVHGVTAASRAATGSCYRCCCTRSQASGHRCGRGGRWARPSRPAASAAPCGCECRPRPRRRRAHRAGGGGDVRQRSIASEGAARLEEERRRGCCSSGGGSSGGGGSGSGSGSGCASDALGCSCLVRPRGGARGRAPARRAEDVFVGRGGVGGGVWQQGCRRRGRDDHGHLGSRG
jgi:hypothetical protein